MASKMNIAQTASGIHAFEQDTHHHPLANCIRDWLVDCKLNPDLLCRDERVPQRSLCSFYEESLSLSYVASLYRSTDTKCVYLFIEAAIFRAASFPTEVLAYIAGLNTESRVPFRIGTKETENGLALVVNFHSFADDMSVAFGSEVLREHWFCTAAIRAQLLERFPSLILF